MPSWFRRIFQSKAGRGGDQPAAAPEWAAQLLEQLQRSARAQARLVAHVEELDRKQGAGLEELGSAVRLLRASALPARWEELWDAMDGLEEAGRSIELGAHSGLAHGLRLILGRLERFLSQGGLTRISPPRGGAPDGRLFRVAGVEESPELPEGAITRVVRAAVVHGERVVREGEVLINRRTPT